MTTKSSYKYGCFIFLTLGSKFTKMLFKWVRKLCFQVFDQTAMMVSLFQQQNDGTILNPHFQNSFSVSHFFEKLQLFHPLLKCYFFLKRKDNSYIKKNPAKQHAIHSSFSLQKRLINQAYLSVIKEQCPSCLKFKALKCFVPRLTRGPLFSVALTCWLHVRITWNTKKQVTNLLLQKLTPQQTKNEGLGSTPRGF